ncbi:hypothetical protein J4208_06115 [Candidatus Woesearchaeota archaeon]|nr:hypothetical protein [Candidatus Woesearchaeota archaeon]
MTSPPTSEPSRKEFPQTLTEITGLEKKDGLLCLLYPKFSGKIHFLNSGVGLTEDFPVQQFRQPPKTLYQSVGLFATNYFRQGPKLNIARACLAPEDPEPPHFHPGGEIAKVLVGEYFDADLDGNPFRFYQQGSTVFYSKGSTHRPLTRDGALVEYITFDGLVEGKNAEDLLRLMQATPKTSDEALAYALLWMVPDEEERTRLRTQLGL